MQDGVKTIGNGAFLCCDSLVQMELPEALTDVGEFAFAYCESLASVRFSGDKVTALPDRLFYGCHSLSRLRLPGNITSVGKRAFSGCRKLESIYFGEPLSSLGAYAFENCAKLTSLTVSAEVIPTGLVSGCSELSWFSVADGTVRIEKEAFGSSGVTSVNIPASVTEIEAGAFFHVHESVMLDEENTSYRLIDGSLYTADGKTLLAFFPADPYAEEPQTEFTVPDGVETIAAYAFAESSLTSVILPSSLKKIDAYAFADTNLEKMVIQRELPLILRLSAMPDRKIIRLMIPARGKCRWKSVRSRERKISSVKRITPITNKSATTILTRGASSTSPTTNRRELR